MNYLKRQIDAQDEQMAQANLSAKQDARTAPEGTPATGMRILDTPQCDWCADGVPLYVYAASRFSDGRAVPPGFTCWRWMACSRCNRDIERGNWDALERRAKARFKLFLGDKLAEMYKDRPVPDSLITEAVRASLQQFHEYAIKIEG